MSLKGKVEAVCKSAEHTMSKYVQSEITLLSGLGVKGDAHIGKSVQHLSRIKKDSSTPNLRQVHLIHQELFDELKVKGFNIMSGQMGENITTVGINILDLPLNTILHLGKQAKVKVTGLRNPCHQLEGIQKGLMAATLDNDKNGQLIRKCGIMSTVIEGGVVFPGDEIIVEFPTGRLLPLDKV